MSREVMTTHLQASEQVDYSGFCAKLLSRRRPVMPNVFCLVKRHGFLRRYNKNENFFRSPLQALPKEDLSHAWRNSIQE